MDGTEHAAADRDRAWYVLADGTALSLVARGEGPPLLMVHGWSQSAAQFRYQFDAFAERFRVIAYDQRGHGQSDRPAHGYRVHRLAADLRELLAGLDLDDVILLGHSMGCAVIWAYLDLYGEDRLSRLVLVDEPSCLFASPRFSPEEIADYGAIFTAEAARDLDASLTGGDSDAFRDAMMDSMLTEACPDLIRAWMKACNRQMPAEHAARLIANNIALDWRDVIARIGLPTLCIGAEASVTTPQCMRHAASQIARSELEIFGASEGGSHFMFVENPGKFNARVLDFLA